MHDVKKILEKTVNLKKVFRAYPEFFELKKLDFHEKIVLLQNDYKLFSNYIDLNNLTVDERAHIIVNNYNVSFLQNGVSLDKDEVPKITNRHYLLKLIRKDIGKYLTAESFGRLYKDEQQDLFLENPEVVCAALGYTPKLTSNIVYALSFDNPKFIDQHVSDFSKISTSAEFWFNMFKFNRNKYRGVFLDNMKTLLNKTELRNVFRKNPSFIKCLTIDNITNSKLTIKEWLLLIKFLLEQYPSTFDGWSFSKEHIEVFQLDLTAEMLMGKSKTSSHLQRAMARIFGQKDESNN